MHTLRLLVLAAGTAALTACHSQRLAVAPLPACRVLRPGAAFPADSVVAINSPAGQVLPGAPSQPRQPRPGRVARGLARRPGFAVRPLLASRLGKRPLQQRPGAGRSLHPEDFKRDIYWVCIGATLLLALLIFGITVTPLAVGILLGILAAIVLLFDVFFLFLLLMQPPT